VDPRYRELLSLVPVVDRAIPVNPRGGVAALLGAIRSLRRTGYDAVLDLQGLLKSAALARLAGARRVIGLPRSHLREPLARLFYGETPDPGASPHVTLKNVALTRAVGVTDTRLEFPIEVQPTDAVRGFAAQFGAVGYGLLNPGAAWPNKRWPPERFGSLAAAIRDRSGLRSVVVWGPGEEARASAVVRASGGAAVQSPPTTLQDLVAILKGARVVVSGDTGPLHIAAALATPVVALFGPTFPERNGPWDPRDVVVSRSDRCVCHYARRCRVSSPCIEDIGLDEVVAAVIGRLRIDELTN
jgi:ADP-heptose:LPS heptosyltransferase